MSPDVIRDETIELPTCATSHGLKEAPSRGCASAKRMSVERKYVFRGPETRSLDPRLRWLTCIYRGSHYPEVQHDCDREVDRHHRKIGITRTGRDPIDGSSVTPTSSNRDGPDLRAVMALPVPRESDPSGATSSRRRWGATTCSSCVSRRLDQSTAQHLLSPRQRRVSSGAQGQCPKLHVHVTTAGLRPRRCPYRRPRRAQFYGTTST